VARLVASLGMLFVAVTVAAACGGNGDDETGAPVAYEGVQAVFEEYGCTGCHPGVNASLDLTEGNSYEQLVGVQALEDPTLYRVVAGDPERSFLYLKLGGAAPVADIPAIGTRMPPRAPPIDAEDLDLVRRWILQGAKDVDGQTGGPQVPTPGTPPGDLDVDPATETEGSATIVGSVVDQRFQPIEGALVTMLLAGAGEEGGEEHYRVAVTDAEGRFTLADASTGRYLLKAYGPNTIYVSRIVALEDGERQEVRFGLPDRIVENPTVASPQVDGTSLSLTVEGTDLDGNYTLAVNPGAGLVFELHNAGNAPGTWSTTIPRELEGPWIFMAVDETCNVSEFLTVGR
jgi:Carboxypeptidase regulatory-like domain